MDNLNDQTSTIKKPWVVGLLSIDFELVTVLNVFVSDENRLSTFPCLASGGDLDDFDYITLGDGGGVDFAGEEGDLVVLDDDGFAGEAEAFEQVGDGGGGFE